MNKKKLLTLDEVITELQTIGYRYELDGCFYCSFLRKCNGDGNCYLVDAYHYLNEYQKITEVCHEHGIRSLWGFVLPEPDKVKGNPNFLDIDNPALTWDELETMQGEPVWLERPEWKEWLLISEIDKDKSEIYLRDKWGNGVSVNYRNVGYWRAYRKERYEDA